MTSRWRSSRINFHGVKISLNFSLIDSRFQDLKTTVINAQLLDNDKMDDSDYYEDASESKRMRFDREISSSDLYTSGSYPSPEFMVIKFLLNSFNIPRYKERHCHNNFSFSVPPSIAKSEKDAFTVLIWIQFQDRQDFI